jgi:hypothetical protein
MGYPRLPVFFRRKHMTMLSEELLVRHCAPTLAGLKTGNIFSCELQDREALRGDLRELNRIVDASLLRYCVTRQR